MTAPNADRQPYFIAQAIPYVNGRPHVGHALEAVLADAYARFHRQVGDDVFFLSGSDENSLKNVQAAEAMGIPTQELVDRNVQVFQELYAALGLSNDDFIRTSVEARHIEGAKKIWEAMVAAGDVYTKSYSGLYCVGCEQFYTPDELVEGRCPEHGTVPELVEEANAFFRLSRYQGQLHDLIASDEVRIVPRERKNEVLRFIEAGLEDFSISRSRERAHGWGIAVPDDPGQVMYVWVDALSNYITALDYANDGDAFARYWLGSRERVQVIGKGILRFHAIYWPAMLLSVGLPVPTHVVVHGYLTVDGQKMSKSLGNTVDPLAVAGEYGADPLRYYLLRDISPFNDGDFSVDKLLGRYRADLANDLGNLLNRTVSMLQRYRDGAVPGVRPEASEPIEDELVQVIAVASARVELAMAEYNPQEALAAIWDIVSRANAYVEVTAPWQLAKLEKDGAPPGRLDTVLTALAITLARIAFLLEPFLPETSRKITDQLGGGGIGAAPRPGQRVAEPKPIFPRFEDA
ncbi:MAG: methionine--tRNA ligase [Chloroflexota bacterium]|nr:methionine--tRNA ligase [Chloroflexota bacterium]